MNLSQIRAALEQACVSPVKTLGQNFLHDQNLARWIVEQAEVSAQDFVVEIGPGLGALTEEVVRRGARVLALEKDGRLANYLREKFANEQVEIQKIDALKFDTRVLFAERNVKLLGNLPYYIATPILESFIEFPSCISLSVLMLQDELTRRLGAKAGDDYYGALTLRMQAHHHVEYLRKIPRSVFFPQPNVDSALVRIAPRDENKIEILNEEFFRRLVRAGFSQRRKQLRKLLADFVDDWESAAARIGAEVTARAEELSRAQWIALANFLSSADENTSAQTADECFTVVDENDRQIDLATRAKVHENNLRHRAVHIFLWNRAGELLLQKRSSRKDRHPGCWDSSAAGHVDAGEEYDATAARELKEELGIETKLERVGKISASEKTGQEFIWLYRGQHDGPFPFNHGEIDAVRFFHREIVARWIENKPEDFAPGFLECWKLAPSS